MNEDTPPTTGVARVREQAHRLAGELSGPLRRMRVRSGDDEVEVEWQEPATGPAPAPAPADDPEPDGTDETRQLVVSPMVGTFYHASEPGAEKFVDVGDPVEVGQVIGIVEAMKLMNPIVSTCAGTVDEVLAADAEPVEFGRPLLAVVPD